MKKGNKKASKSCNAWSIFYFPTLRRGRGGKSLYDGKLCTLLQKSENDTHTQTQNCTEGKTLCQVQHYIYMYVYMSASSAKHFVYNSCLFVACNLAVGRKVKVSKL